MGTTLSSVLSSTALRLSALVAAAMSAGYLWRAAVEPGGTAAKPSAVQSGLRLQPPDISFDTLDLLRSAEAEEEPAGGQADAVAQEAKPGAQSSAHLVSVTVGASHSGSAASAPARRSTHPVRTKPTKRGRRPRPRPAPPPRRNPPPPPAPQPPPPPPPPPAPPPVAPPPPPPASSSARLCRRDASRSRSRRPKPPSHGPAGPAEAQEGEGRAGRAGRRGITGPERLGGRAEQRRRRPRKRSKEGEGLDRSAHWRPCLTCSASTA